MDHHTLIGGVGYAWQGDLAFGLAVLEALRTESWPPGVELADLSHNPITVFQQIRVGGYQRLILVGSAAKGILPGALAIRRPDEPLPPPEEIQARVIESGSGIISLENIVIICRYYDALPADTQIVEIEPVDDLWGSDLSAPARVSLEQAVAYIRDYVFAYPAAQPAAAAS